MRSSALGAPPEIAREISAGAACCGWPAATGHAALLPIFAFTLASLGDASAAAGVRVTAASTTERGNHRDSPATKWAGLLMPPPFPGRRGNRGSEESR